MLSFFSPSPATTDSMSTLTATLTTTTATNTTLASVRSPRKRKLVLSYLVHYLSLVYDLVYTFFITPLQQPLLLTRSSQKTRTTARQPTVKGALQYYKGKTLVLDLDETLVHSVRLGSAEEASSCPVSPCIKRKQIEVRNDKQSLLYQVYKRPHVDFFLKTVSERKRLCG